jgi:hypothetical protein
MPRPPTNGYWRRFCADYLASQGFWYVPKGEAVNDLPRIKARLALLRERFDRRPWRATQLDYVRELRRSGLFAPRARGQESEDRAAIARMVKVVFDTLGLAWVDEDDAVFISPAGTAFLESSSPEDVIEGQLWKYQFWNPAIRGDQYAGIHLFPYALLTEVLLSVEDGVTPEEYNLFVCRAAREDSARQVIAQIERWRRLDERSQARVISYLDSVSTQSAKTGDRVSLYTRVARCQPYAWALFSSSNQFIERTHGFLRILEGKVPLAKQRLERHQRDSTFIRFENEKEWFSYYGDNTVENSYATALSVYETRYDIGRAVEALRGARERALVDPSLTDETFISTVVRERVIEDVLEHQLHLLEPGLTLFVEGETSGRQYQTERGIIDLLARDTSGNWVVIELKRQRAGDKVMGQTLRYIGWVRDNKLEPRQEVRGIIVGRQIDLNLVSAARGVHPLPIKLCEFDFRLRIVTKYPPPEAQAS